MTTHKHKTVFGSFVFLSGFCLGVAFADKSYAALFFSAITFFGYLLAEHIAEEVA